jgi:hypothetical protein
VDGVDSEAEGTESDDQQAGAEADRTPPFDQVPSGAISSDLEA